MEIETCNDDLQKSIFYAFLAVIAQVFLLAILSWHKIAIIGCVVLSIILGLSLFLDYLYFSRKIMLDASGCAFVSKRTTRKYTWEELYVQHTENPPYLIQDGEISGEGVIVSCFPIPKTLGVGAMTYCRYKHPSASVFIRFISPDEADKIIQKAGKLIYRGYIADKDQLLAFLKTHKQITQ